MISNCDILLLAAGCSRRLSSLTRDFPKSFLKIGNKKIINYHLDFLSEKGVKEITIVVGYLRDKFFDSIGTNYNGMKINYIISEDYDTTGHSWSIYQARSLWKGTTKSLLLIHADVFCDYNIISDILSSKHDDVIAVSELSKSPSLGDCSVYGESGCVSSIEFFEEKKNKLPVGEYIGISKWSNSFIKEFETFLKNYFVQTGKEHNYEIPLNKFINYNGKKLFYDRTKYLWKNINYESDYILAKNKIYNEIYRSL